MTTAEQWDALARLVSFSVAPSALRSLDARVAQRELLETELAAWCADHDAFELAARLQAAGVPSYPVLRPTDLHEDPQLRHRGFFVTLDHPVMGPTPYDGPRDGVLAHAGAVAQPSAAVGTTQRRGPAHAGAGVQAE